MEMSTEEKLQYIAVRLEDKCNIIGSGILWQENETSNNVYIYTAAHVVENKDKITINYITEEKKSKKVEVLKDNIKIHEKYENLEDQDVKFDVAIIKIDRNKLDKLKYIYYDIETEMKKNINNDIILRGFSKKFNVKEIKLSGTCLKGEFENIDTDLKAFTYILNKDIQIDLSDRDEELEGFSGAGIFKKHGKNLTLVGIHSGGLGSNSALSKILAMSVELLLDICMMLEYPVPKGTQVINGFLIDAVKNFEMEIRDDNLLDIMDELIKNDFSHVIKAGFCKSSKKCKLINQEHCCQIFRNDLLIFVCLLKYINESVDYKNPCIKIDEDNICIRYICSEGDECYSRINMQQFIRSIKTDYLNKNKVENNSIIIWGSEKSISGNQHYCGYDQFKNIVSQINQYSNDEKPGVNIIDGIRHPRRLAIISMNEILSKLQGNLNVEEVIQYIKKII